MNPFPCLQTHPPEYLDLLTLDHLLHELLNGYCYLLIIRTACMIQPYLTLSLRAYTCGFSYFTASPNLCEWSDPLTTNSVSQES